MLWRSGAVVEGETDNFKGEEEAGPTYGELLGTLISCQVSAFKLLRRHAPRWTRLNIMITLGLMLQ
jgi:hypothetical protein